MTTKKNPATLNDLLENFRSNIEDDTLTVRKLSAARKKFAGHELMSLLIDEQVELLTEKIHMVKASENIATMAKNGEMSLMIASVHCACISKGCRTVTDQLVLIDNIMGQVFAQEMLGRRIEA